MSEERTAVCKKTYTDGEKTFATMPADPSAIVALHFGFTDNDDPFIFDPDNYSEEMQRAFMFFGASECLGNSYAGVKGDVVAARESLLARNATILGGFWTSRTGGGAGSKSDSILAAAMLAHFADIGKTEDKAGATIDATWIRNFLLATDVSDDDAKEVRSTRAKSWKANPDVREHYDIIRAERETAKAATVEAAHEDDI